MKPSRIMRNPVHGYICLVRGQLRTTQLAAVLAVAAVLAAPGVAQAASGPTLLSQTTWGGPGTDTGTGIAVTSDGSAYVTGLSNSFTTDAFGQPSAAIFAVKFAANGSLTWQRAWTGPTVFGSFGSPAAALAPDGSVYVVGTTTLGSDEGVILKFDPSGNLLWQRALSAGTRAQEAMAVATGADGSAYVVGTIIDFANGTPTQMSITKIAPDGTLVWQKAWTTASGMAVAVAPDGSVYAAGSALVPGQPTNTELVALKLAPDGSLVWARTFAAGTLADPRGGAVAGPDGSLYLAGSLQGGRTGAPALIVKLNPDGTLAFDRGWGSGATAAGISLAADGTLFVSGTQTTTSTTAFVIHLLASGRVIDASTWAASSSGGFTNGGGVGVAGDGTIRVAATATSPPYVFAATSRTSSAAKGTLATATGTLADAADTISDPAQTVITPNGTTTFGGAVDAALLSISP